LTRATALSKLNELLAALRERRGLDRQTVVAMVSERSRQRNVTLAEAFKGLVAELDHALDHVAASTAQRVFRSAKDVADAAVEYRLLQSRRQEQQ
jgi:hypothetical protein